MELYIDSNYIYIYKYISPKYLSLFRFYFHLWISF